MMRSSCGKYDCAKTKFVVDRVRGCSGPPADGTAYAFQIPVRFDETRSRRRSADHEAPEKDVLR